MCLTGLYDLVHLIMSVLTMTTPFISHKGFIGILRKLLKINANSHVLVLLNVCLLPFSGGLPTTTDICFVLLISCRIILRRAITWFCYMIKFVIVILFYHRWKHCLVDFRYSRSSLDILSLNVL